MKNFGEVRWEVLSIILILGLAFSWCRDVRAGKLDIGRKDVLSGSLDRFFPHNLNDEWVFKQEETFVPSDGSPGRSESFVHLHKVILNDVTSGKFVVSKFEDWDGDGTFESLIEKYEFIDTKEEILLTFFNGSLDIPEDSFSVSFKPPIVILRQPILLSKSFTTLRRDPENYEISIVRTTTASRLLDVFTLNNGLKFQDVLKVFVEEGHFTNDKLDFIILSTHWYALDIGEIKMIKEHNGGYMENVGDRKDVLGTLKKFRELQKAKINGRRVS
jgi:hypothetical protein